MKTPGNLLESALNRFLALDPESKLRLRALENKVVTIELLKLGLTFQLVFLNEKIILRWDEFTEPNTILKGTPLTLLQMAMTKGSRNHFFADDVTIEGDLELGQQVIDIFDRLEIDWEEYASKWVGDVPAHHLGNIVRNFKDLGERLRSTILQNLNEYVHEEVDLFPPNEALNDFFADVDQLRMDVDRIETRIKFLAEK